MCHGRRLGRVSEGLGGWRVVHQQGHEPELVRALEDIQHVHPEESRRPSLPVSLLREALHSLQVGYREEVPP